MNGEERIISGTLPGGERLDKALSLASGLSRERIKTLMGEGRVALDGIAASQASLKPAAGTAFAIAVPATAPAEATKCSTLFAAARTHRFLKNGITPAKAEVMAIL